jgi:hypothetical protein
MRAVVQRDVVAAVVRRIRQQPLGALVVRRGPDVPVAVDARAVPPIAGTGTRRSS